jgi:hypothetical protein
MAMPVVVRALISVAMLAGFYVLTKYELTLHSGEKLAIRWGAEAEELADGTALLAKALQSVTRD